MCLPLRPSPSQRSPPPCLPPLLLPPPFSLPRPPPPRRLPPRPAKVHPSPAWLFLLLCIHLLCMGERGGFVVGQEGRQWCKNRCLASSAAGVDSRGCRYWECGGQREAQMKGEYVEHRPPANGCPWVSLFFGHAAGFPNFWNLTSISWTSDPLPPPRLPPPSLLPPSYS